MLAKIDIKSAFCSIAVILLFILYLVQSYSLFILVTFLTYYNMIHYIIHRLIVITMLQLYYISLQAESQL